MIYFLLMQFLITLFSDSIRYCETVWMFHSRSYMYKCDGNKGFLLPLPQGKPGKLCSTKKMLSSFFRVLRDPLIREPPRTHEGSRKCAFVEPVALARGVLAWPWLCGPLKHLLLWCVAPWIIAKRRLWACCGCQACANRLPRLVFAKMQSMLPSSRQALCRTPRGSFHR
jgi:hypothetical protein